MKDGEFILYARITAQKLFEDVSALNNGIGFIAPLGVNNGTIEYADFSQINSLIVCGTTGSGKTAFIKTVIASLISTNPPENLKLCIFDSLKINYLEFATIPHLLMPILNDVSRCSGMLSWALDEAEKRTLLLDKTTIDSKFPDVFVILDDYAQVAQNIDIQKTLYKLIQINHRVKIHIFIATSIDLAEIIPTKIKAHISHRISFFLPERRNSLVVIDQNGAETLKMPGQFIAKFDSEAKTYNSLEISDDDIKNICNMYVNKENTVTSNTNLSDDELYNAAVLAVIEIGEASTTILQRALYIGYGRASKLLDCMLENGIIGPRNISKVHPILITKEQFLHNKP